MGGKEAQRGFTLMEVVIALGITGMLVAGLGAALSLTLTQAPKQGAKLAVENRHQLARYWIARDANSAESFTPGTGTTYGTFTWRDFSGESTVTYDVAYRYDSTIKAVTREEKKNSVIQSTFQVAADILQQSDVTFVWNASQRKVTVTITPTIQEAHAVGDISRTGTLTAFLRFEGEGAVSPPSDVPIPTPVPGTVNYLVAADPVVLAGTFVSGNAASLQTSDTDFYKVSSTSGNPKITSWEVFSQTISSPSPVGGLEVRYTGKADKTNVSMNFFVKVGASSSYSATADFGFTFTAADTEATRFIFLDASKVSELNSATTKVLYLKVESSASAIHVLSSNQVLFIASP